MVVIRNAYTKDNICVCNNETDAFEMLMALTEAYEYESFCDWINHGADIKIALEWAGRSAEWFVRASYFQELPCLKEDE